MLYMWLEIAFNCEVKLMQYFLQRLLELGIPVEIEKKYIYPNAGDFLGSCGPTAQVKITNSHP